MSAWLEQMCYVRDLEDGKFRKIDWGQSRTLSARMRILTFYLLDDWKLAMCFEQEIVLAKRQFGKIM